MQSNDTHKLPSSFPKIIRIVTHFRKNGLRHLTKSYREREVEVGHFYEPSAESLRITANSRREEPAESAR